MKKLNNETACVLVLKICSNILGDLLYIDFSDAMVHLTRLEFVDQSVS